MLNSEFTLVHFGNLVVVLVVVGVVVGVEDVVLDRLRVLSQILNVVGTNEPFAIRLLWN